MLAQVDRIRRLTGAAVDPEGLQAAMIPLLNKAAEEAGACRWDGGGGERGEGSPTSSSSAASSVSALLDADKGPMEVDKGEQEGSWQTSSAASSNPVDSEKGLLKVDDNLQSNGECRLFDRYRT